MAAIVEAAASALPKALQGKAPLDYVKAPVTDPDAYALIVEGDCMKPLIHHGDIAIVTPHADAAGGEHREITRGVR